MKSKGLVIIHIDALGYKYVNQAIKQGTMPFLKDLIDQEDYEVLPYRCGLPSLTPASQAGIIYGDKSEIPNFQWWDKESGVHVSLGPHSNFALIAHKYFVGREALTKDGACIAACFPGQAKETFGLAYRDHQKRSGEFWPLIRFFFNPFHLGDFLSKAILGIVYSIKNFLMTKILGKQVEIGYVLTDLLYELILHYLTRFAVIRAMRNHCPVIYAGFYTYDEVAHGYGPENKLTIKMLSQVDSTIKWIWKNSQQKGWEYKIVILSDHGQTETIPIKRKFKKTFGQILSDFLPNFEIEEHIGFKKNVLKTKTDRIDGHIVLTYCGGWATLYFKEFSWRMNSAEIENKFPGLIKWLAKNEAIDFIIVKNKNGQAEIFAGSEHFLLAEKLDTRTLKFLAKYDEPEILAKQIRKLNAYLRTGDIMLVGKFFGDRQINFESQVGGHGSLGGEQLHPFLMVKKEWKIDTSKVTETSDLYPLIKMISVGK